MKRTFDLLKFKSKIYIQHGGVFFASFKRRKVLCLFILLLIIILCQCVINTHVLIPVFNVTIT